MAKQMIAGETINGVVRQLNETGVRTATGKTWHHTIVRQVLTSPRIAAGLRSHNGAIYPGNFAAIISVSEWELLQVALARLHRTWSGGVQQGRKYLLTGLVYCGNCDQPMHGGSHKSFREEEPRPRYRCDDRPGATRPSCGKVTRLAASVDILVTEAVLYALDTTDLSLGPPLGNLPSV